MCTGYAKDPARICEDCVRTIIEIFAPMLQAFKQLKGQARTASVHGASMLRAQKEKDEAIIRNRSMHTEFTAKREELEKRVTELEAEVEEWKDKVLNSDFLQLVFTRRNGQQDAMKHMEEFQQFQAMVEPKEPTAEEFLAGMPIDLLRAITHKDCLICPVKSSCDVQEDGDESCLVADAVLRKEEEESV